MGFYLNKTNSYIKLPKFLGVCAPVLETKQSKMFNRNFMNSFEDDPFFSDMPPFNTPSFEALEGRQGGRNGDRREGRMVDPFSNMFKGFDEMRNQMMGGIQMGDKDGHSFSHSSVMIYSNDGKSKPKYYQATSTTRTAPGQMKETRKTVRDSSRDLHKMSIGHHLGNRGRIVERRRLRGEDEEHRNFVGMHGEDEFEQFDNEWRNKASGFLDYPANMSDNRMSGQLGLPSNDARRYKKEKKTKRQRQVEFGVEGNEMRRNSRK